MPKLEGREKKNLLKKLGRMKQKLLANLERLKKEKPDDYKIQINNCKNQIAMFELTIKELRETGNYGICGVCEEEISPERLEADPTTHICTECKERNERKKKLDKQLQQIVENKEYRYIL